MEIIYNNQTIKILTNCGFKTIININLQLLLTIALNYQIMTHNYSFDLYNFLSSSLFSLLSLSLFIFK